MDEGKRQQRVHRRLESGAGRSPEPPVQHAACRERGSGALPLALVGASEGDLGYRLATTRQVVQDVQSARGARLEFHPLLQSNLTVAQKREFPVIIPGVTEPDEVDV